MCTFINQSNILSQIAHTDIETYKVVKIKGDRWFAPYRKCEYQDKHICDVIDNPDYYGKIYDDIWGEPQSVYAISRGIHSFISVIDAIDNATYLDMNFSKMDENYVVVKSIIPEGSLYYNGYNELRTYKLLEPSYVSNHLILGDDTNIVYKPDKLNKKLYFV